MRPFGRRERIGVGVAVLVWLALTSGRLAYNSVYHDEAFHILLGRELLAGLDCPGCAYATGCAWIHPVAAALGDSIGGLTGARLVNVLFALGLAAIVSRSARLLFDGSHGAVTAFVFLFTGQTLYLAKLATYDMLAAFFLGGSFLILLEAERAPRESGRLARLTFAAIVLFLAGITKYLVPVFVPVLLVYVIARHGPRRATLAFLLPLVVLFTAYALWLVPEREALLGTMSASREVTQVPRMTLLSWTLRWIALPLLIAVFGCFHPRHGRKALALIALSLPIVGLHLVTGAEQSVNKNVLLALVFLAPAVAVGAERLAHIFSTGMTTGPIRSFYLGAVMVVFGVYGIYHLKWLERQYPDLAPVVRWLAQNGRDGMTVGINSTYGDAVYLYELGPLYPKARFFYLEGPDQRGGVDEEALNRADFLVFDGYYGKGQPLSAYRNRLDGDFEVLEEFTIDLAWGDTEARILGRRTS